ncbi:choice-of-anchor X domain-containing protein [Tahibacter harae]|uniref:Conditioned medium factor n=1 Tax=Tahibacter harae TaxID=2963937 RepID=A0ABT1QYJ9_9GAMM|nr:conditioned medium factor [Tahibacter harae]
MSRSPLTLAVLSTLLLAAPLAQAASEPIPKQLSGPAEEFAQMRAPDPADAAVFSHSALLPVQMDADKASWTQAIPVENGSVRFLLFSGPSAHWQLQLAAPTGRSVLQAELAEAARATDFALEGASVPATLYALDGLESGDWQLRIDGDAGRDRSGYVLLEGDEATELMSYPAHRRQLVGEQLDVVATLGDAGRIAQAQLRVTAPDGSVQSYPMFDDGKHADALAGDGIYGAGFAARTSGTYVAQVVAQGHSRAGSRVLRTAEHVLPVVESHLSLNSRATVEASAAGRGRYSLDIPVASRDSEPRHYRAYAEVWGRDARGQALPVAWVSGMVTPRNGKLGLGFDQRWQQLTGARGPYELRELRIEDPDHFVTVAAADRLSLQLPDAPLRAGARVSIDESMRMGPRPAAQDLTRGVGQRLLLVHGYCSGGVWPASQFSTASTFLDTNQNRSHDQFARLLQSFGSTWNSFGTVAHSQGGAASLHLYTYYWSGLDNATGARLIQSVGTPYKGTNLAGILATLGSWFGVGCGTNDNLSYNGAAAWLAGIPTSSRAKVNYYTTAFRTTNWWTNDYCQIATDLVLSDPEDGTTEQSNGQLSGGVNRGHTTGQCHTSGMRDPAQYLDSSRNATMNANAAR